MVLPSNLTFKQEKEDYEHEAASIESDYEINFKLEIESPDIHEEIDWCIENRFLHEKQICNSNNDEVDSPCSKASDAVVDYQELIDYNIQTCTMCDRQFYESYSRLRHNLSHLRVKLRPITQKKYQCNDCLRYFMKKESLQQHIIQLHIKKETIPKHKNDDVIFPKSKMLHQCSLCGKIFSYKRWHAHMKEVHCIKRFECPLCKSSFKVERVLRKHYRQVHKRVPVPPENIKCNLCPAVLNNKHALKTHIRNCHCEKVECDICHSVLKKSYLNNHMRRVHYDDGKDHKCECGKTFISPRYLKIHLKNTKGLCKTKKKKSSKKVSKEILCVT